MRLALLVLVVLAASVFGCGGGVGPAAAPAARGSEATPEPLLVPLARAPAPERAEDAGLAPTSDRRESKVPTPRERLEETAKRHRSPVLDEPTARAARVAPGTYACRIDSMYKLRPCTVTKDEHGFTHIAMPGSLLGFEGVLYDDGAAMILDGTSADRRPFGCFSCDENCSEPGSCVCTELPPEASRECLGLPLTARLTKVGATWRGTFTHVSYSNHYEGSGAERRVTSFDTEKQKFVVEIAPPAR